MDTSGHVDFIGIIRLININHYTCSIGAHKKSKAEFRLAFLRVEKPMFNTPLISLCTNFRFVSRSPDRFLWKEKKCQLCSGYS